MSWLRTRFDRQSSSDLSPARPVAVVTRKGAPVDWADEQATSAGLLDIRRTELKPGDLVFFNTMRRTFSHVGIYVGDDKFIHSPRAGGAVRIEDMRDSYWAGRFTGARRADLSAATPQLPTTR